MTLSLNWTIWGKMHNIVLCYDLSESKVYLLIDTFELRVLIPYQSFIRF